MLQSPSPREFIYFQQGAQIGLLDLRYPPSIYKYWTSLSTGEEHVFDLSNDQLELTNLIGPVDPKRLNHWRLHTLKSAAGVVLTETDQ